MYRVMPSYTIYLYKIPLLQELLKICLLRLRRETIIIDLSEDLFIHLADLINSSHCLWTVWLPIYDFEVFVRVI